MSVVKKIEAYVSDVRNKIEDVKITSSATEIKTLIDYEIKELPTEAQPKLIATAFDAALKLYQSTEQFEKKGGLILLNHLVDIESNDCGYKLMVLNEITKSPPSDLSIMELNAIIFSKLVHIGIASSDTFDFELLLFRELSKIVPTMFFPYILDVFNRVSACVTDPRQNIRELSISIIRHAFTTFVPRENRDTSIRRCYETLYKTIFICLKVEGNKTISDDLVHGSLLALQELARTCSGRIENLLEEMNTLFTTTIDIKEILTRAPSINFCRSRWSNYNYIKASQEDNQSSAIFVPFHSQICQGIMETNFFDICDSVLKQCQNKNPLIQALAVSMFPTFSIFKPDAFINTYLILYMKLVISMLQNSKEKTSGFQAVAILFQLHEEYMKPYAEKLLECISLTIPPKEQQIKKRRIYMDNMAIACLSSIMAFGDTSTDKKISLIFKNILDCTTLTYAIVSALSKLLPKLDNPSILVEEIIDIIVNRILKLDAQGLSFSHKMEWDTILTDDDVVLVILALRTIRLFKKSKIKLKKDLYYASEIYLTCPNKFIRLEAGKTCCELLGSSNELFYKDHSFGSFKKCPPIKYNPRFISKVLTLALTDIDPNIRLSMLSTIGDRHDYQLAHPDMLKILFIGLRDESYEVYETVIRMLGRLSLINPSYIIPALDKYLIEALTEVRVYLPNRNCERGARVIASLVSSTPRLAAACMNPILNSIVPSLAEKSLSPDFLMVMFDAIRDLAYFCGSRMKNHSGNILNSILAVLKDSGSYLKKERALTCLIHVLENTGYIMDINIYFSEYYEVLLNIIKTEPSKNIRRMVIHTLGLMGPRDPYDYKKSSPEVVDGKVFSKTQSTPRLSKPDEVKEKNICDILFIYDSDERSDELYATVCIDLLLKLLCDSNMSPYHSLIVQVIQSICVMSGSKGFQYLPQIIPAYIKVIRIVETDMKKVLIEQIIKLTILAKNHISPFINDLFDLVIEIWSQNCPMALQSAIIKLLENFVYFVPDVTCHRLPSLIPRMADILLSDRSNVYDQTNDNQLTTLLLSSIQRMGPFLSDYLFLIVPAIIKGFDGSTKPVPLQVLALKTIQSLYISNNLKDYSALIIQSALRAMDTKPLLHESVMSLICTILEHGGQTIKIFIPTLTQFVSKNKIVYAEFDIIVNHLMSEYSTHFQQDLYYKKCQTLNSHLQYRGEELDRVNISILASNLNNLSRAWQTSQRVSKEDWVDWWNRLNLETLKESPSPILRGCSILSQAYNPIAYELFNLSFLSCWKEFSFKNREDLTKCLCQAMELQDSHEIILPILNLAEFMEHTSVGPLPFKPELLANCAIKASAFVKALRYTEEHFMESKTVNSYEALISLNTRLDHPDAAHGVLLYALKMNQGDLRSQQRWYEKLHDWDNALVAYNKKLEQDPNDLDLLMGKMRCLEALCEWKDLHKLVNECWDLSGEDQRVQLASMGSYSSIGLNDWDSLLSYVSCIPKSTFQGSFIRAICHIRGNSFEKAQAYIDSARDLLDTDLTTSLTESYTRGYRSLIMSLFLTELEEIINFIVFPSQKDTIKQLWRKRLQSCQRVVDDWQKILNLRGLVLHPSDDIEVWVKFSTLCRKTDRLSLCKGAFEKVMSPQNLRDFYQGKIPDVHPLLAYNFTKYMWSSGMKKESFTILEQLSSRILPNLAIQKSKLSLSPSVDCKKLMAKAYHQLGIWMHENISHNANYLAKKVKFFYVATNYDRKWHKAWHSLAIANYDIILSYKHNGTLPLPIIDKELDSSEESIEELEPEKSSKPEDIAVLYVVPAIRAFIKSIFLSEKNSLQDTLRLLTLWFEYGEHKEVSETVEEEIKTIHIDNWMKVVPQLIARMHTSKRRVTKVIQALLISIGCCHPQSLIYPLMVSLRTLSYTKSTPVKVILKNISDSLPGLVEEAKMVSNELLRISIIWLELWHEAIETASRLYFAEKDIESMLKVLDIMHRKTNIGPETPKEISFSQAYQKDLNEAYKFCVSYRDSSNIFELSQAWDIYYQVYRRINKQLLQIKDLDLNYVSPKLVECRDLKLAVPGTYETHRPPIFIQSISHTLKVIGSKQRPRKIAFIGSDGNTYGFLLKGHEDLRQDERVMQLFGLVNSLLFNNQETFKRKLEIKRYSVTPLSPESGLIGWVPNCDTLNSLIREFREKRKILLNRELKMVAKLCPEYDKIDLLHKVEIFEAVIEKTSCDDLAQVMWQRSLNSEIWFKKRTNYIRSLAVMSMVGYILGLGDRHPSNIMQEKDTGTILHIDFGDCFEVAMQRDRYPEKVPFRLTRMLIKCMEVTGIDGTYKITSTRVMEVLRENKDSLLAILEAFIYDPLLNWHLLKESRISGNAGNPSNNISGAGGYKDFEHVSSLFSFGRLSSEMESDMRSNSLSKKAVEVINRVKDKLTGNDFCSETPVTVSSQVQLLIDQAVSIENLCQSFPGWCPYW